MLPRKYRLTKKEIAELKEKKLRLVQGNFFGLIYEPGKEKRFGLIISNKISRRSTERNRVKRLLFLAIREKFLDQKGRFLFLAKKNSLEAKKEDFLEELEEFKKKIK